MYQTQTKATAKTTILPVSLQEAKTHLRINHEDLDEAIALNLEAAVAHLEKILGRSLRVSHTVAQTYSSWPCNPVRLDRQPAYSISSIAYYDADGDSQTVTSTNYRLHQSENAASYIEFDGDYSFPSLATRDDAVTITYLAGFSAITAVPYDARIAILLQLSLLWGDLMPQQATATQNAVNALVNGLEWGCYR